MQFISKLTTCSLALAAVFSIVIDWNSHLWAQSPSSQIDTNAMFETHQHSAENGDNLQYRLLKPAAADGPKSQIYPLVVFLHGAGERGSDNKIQLKHGVFELCTPERRKDFPCFLLAPQCPKNQLWAAFDWKNSEDPGPQSMTRSLELTFQVIDRLLELEPIDPNRIYITGLSMGGYGTWDAIARRPDFFAAAMPICGGGNPLTAEKIKHIPIACFHGAEDKIVQPERSRNIIEAIRKAGGEPLYEEYAGVAHDSWKPAYADEENWKWLFSQRRKPATDK